MTTTLVDLERELWRWVDHLTTNTRRRITRDDLSVEWVTVPSLWRQLIDPATVASCGTDSTGLATGSRPPIDLNVVDIARDISVTVAKAVLFYKIRCLPFPQTDRSLRALALHLVALKNPDTLAGWAEVVRQWVSAVRAALPREEGAPKELEWRGQQCPNVKCRKTHVERREAGETYHHAALIIQLNESKVRAVTCRACNHSWWRGELLDALVDQLQAERTDHQEAA